MTWLTWMMNWLFETHGVTAGDHYPVDQTSKARAMQADHAMCGTCGNR